MGIVKSHHFDHSSPSTVETHDQSNSQTKSNKSHELLKANHELGAPSSPIQEFQRNVGGWKQNRLTPT